MKAVPEPFDPVLQALIDETKELPRAAAAHARSRRSRNQAMLSLSLAVTAMVLAAGIWAFRPSPSHRGAQRLVMSAQTATVDRTPVRPGYVKVYQPGESAPAEILAGASDDEKQLLKQLSDVPVLIVMDKDGQVARVHIFER
jgi:hypothetical protein